MINALRLARRYVRFFPEEQASWDILGVQLKTAGDYDEAVQNYRRGVDRFPDSWLTYQLAIALMIHKKNLGEARSILEAFRERRPESPLPNLGLGYLARTEEDWTGAHTYALKALHLSTPSDWRIGMHVAALLFQIRGAEDEVRGLLEQLAEEKDEPVPHLYLAVLFEGSDAAKSERHFQTANAIMQMPEELLRSELKPIRSLWEHN
jgi:predicted Zn-dependent protease